MKNYNGEPSIARAVRLQVMLSADEMKVLDDFRFEHRMPSRAATVRELIRRGLEAARAPSRGRRRGTGAVLRVDV